jgi:hypothetical protein
MMAITNLIRFNNLQGDIFGGVMVAVVSFLLASFVFGAVSGMGISMGQSVAAFLPLCLAIPQRCSLNQSGQSP